MSNGQLLSAYIVRLTMFVNLTPALNLAIEFTLKEEQPLNENRIIDKMHCIVLSF